MLHSIKLLGTTITSENKEKVLEYVVSVIHTSSDKLFITTPNPEILVYASRHLDYKDKLNSSKVALPDGIGLLLGSWFMGRPIKERITGVDFIEMLCLESREKPMSMGFLGGRGGVAELTAQRLQEKYPWIKVVWVGEEWDFGKNDAFRSGSEGKVEGGPVDSLPPTSARKLRAVGSPSSVATPRLQKPIDILFVAFGFPRQEEWIYENLPKLPVKAAMGVGGAFDYLSGKVIRAPQFVQMIGLEWLFRLVVQPWRWRRQLSLFVFLYLIVKERFGRKSG